MQAWLNLLYCETLTVLPVVEVGCRVVKTVQCRSASCPGCCFDVNNLATERTRAMTLQHALLVRVQRQRSSAGHWSFRSFFRKQFRSTMQFKPGSRLWELFKHQTVIRKN